MIYGWILVAISYFVTFLLSIRLGNLFFPHPSQTNILLSADEIERHQFLMSFFVGTCLLIIPYIIAGIYASKKFKDPIKGAFEISLIPVVFERILIFLIGAYHASQTVLIEGWNVYTVIELVQAKTPAFYFTILYIILGIISILTSIGIASSTRKRDVKYKVLPDSERNKSQDR